MKKTLKSLGRTAAAGSVIMFGLAFLAGCGDETTEVTETIGLGNVAKGEKMPECTADNQGDMIYVVDSAATYFCQDKKWQSLKGEAGEKGDDGKNGENGTSCSAKQTKDKSGYEITCGDKVIGTIKNGEKGDKGEDGEDGDDGASCTAKVLEDGAGIEVSCDGTVIDTLKNGAPGASGKSAFELSGFEGTQAEWLASLKGEAGASCTVAENKAKNGYDVTCGGKTVTVTNGTDGDGKSCKATAVEGGVSIKCGTDEPVVLKNGENGKSAFEIAKENDPTLKTEAEWLASLKGDAGEGCTAEAVEGGVEITCPGSEDAVTITDGVGCTVADNATNSAYVTITCGTTKKDIAKAICSKSAYDPEKRFCYQVDENHYILGAYCGNSGRYDPREKFCDFRNNKLYGYKYYVHESNRVWAMTENLNYNDDVDAYCDFGTVGENAEKVSTDCPTTTTKRQASLYKYHTAMGCSETECGTDHPNVTGNNVQGVCPTGWTMMSKAIAEWLIGRKAYDGDDNDANDTYYYQTMEDDNGHVATTGKYANNTKFTTIWVTGYKNEVEQDNSKGLVASYSTVGAMDAYFESVGKAEAYGVRCIKTQLPWAYAY